MSQPRGPGRPPVGPRVGVCLEPELIDRIDRIRNGRTRAETIRAILDQHVPSQDD